jgi:hypothetical protein
MRGRMSKGKIPKVSFPTANKSIKYFAPEASGYTGERREEDSLCRPFSVLSACGPRPSSLLQKTLTIMCSYE